jgi:hypothetical protein
VVSDGHNTPTAAGQSIKRLLLKETSTVMQEEGNNHTRAGPPGLLSGAHTFFHLSTRTLAGLAALSLGQARVWFDFF